DRPLSPRGERAAGDLAKAMAKRGLQPDQVLCSPARRTQETLAVLLPGLPNDPRVTVLDGLYEASPGDYLSLIAQHGDEAVSLMVVGHNPTVQATALILSGDSERRFTSDISLKYPTGALTVVDFDMDSWTELGPGGGRIVDFLKPRDLEGNV
ncbi:MAG: histidine phosphatase family protein, partial [bacterium]|nr:histidine phosphatase family protein [bacterium]